MSSDALGGGLRTCARRPWEAVVPSAKGQGRWQLQGPAGALLPRTDRPVPRS